MKGLFRSGLWKEAGVHGKRRLGAVSLALSVMLLLGGCGSTDSAKTADVAVSNGSSMQFAAESAVEGGSLYSTTSEPKEYMELEKGKAVESESQTDITDRKLIKTVNMDVETQEFDVLMSTVEGQVKELGGYIENMNTYNGSSYYSHSGTRNADLTIRIPKDKLDGFLESVSGASNVIRRSETVEDVTLTYVDLESHRDALQTEQERLLELLEKAESIEDIITIEERLSNVRYQLESMESQLRTYDNQVDYSTVYLNIEEVEIFTPVEEETAWERISGGFTESVQDIGEGFVEFGIWFVVHIPYMVVWCLILALMIGGIVLLVKLLNRKAAKQQKQQNANVQSIKGQNLPGQTQDANEKK